MQELEDLKLNNHTHNGVDAPQINPIDLQGFPVFTATPTHEAEQGTIVLVDDGSSTRKLCAMLGGTWYCVTLS